ncbi:cytochrome C [Caulobacter sp. Root1455]|uniref:c-type cytochrome n=1 Tax=Caulobacter sp. Root1455 TaxID=1736465 RepID=UPI0006FEBDC1|nr:c-type cytochrome [Caulobacter sp. Root1455]KQY91536.1 cytochrome C [Caulobacter sp. Root1455]
MTRRWPPVILVILLTMTASPALAGPPTGDPARGERLYAGRCGFCHSLDANRFGPRHRGVYGRRAGAVADFHYSKALASRDVTWNAETLDAWLADPKRFAPGTAMGARTPSPQDRADLIAYLRAHP